MFLIVSQTQRCNEKHRWFEDKSRRLVFLLIFSFDFIYFCGRGPELCMRASISSSTDVYYPGTNPFTGVHHAMIIVLIGDLLYAAKGVQQRANYTSQAARCVVEPGPQMMLELS
jgi:hypothetical protein